MEKAVELGAGKLCPVLTQRTEVRRLNIPKMQQWVIEAAEQCERLDVPVLEDIQDLRTALLPGSVVNEAIGHYFAAIERSYMCNFHLLDALQKNGPLSKAPAFLIGPEGGFTAEECHFFSSVPSLSAVSLGPNVLRSETSVVYCLSLCQGLASMGTRNPS